MDTSIPIKYIMVPEEEFDLNSGMLERFVYLII